MGTRGRIVDGGGKSMYSNGGRGGRGRFLENRSPEWMHCC